MSFSFIRKLFTNASPVNMEQATQKVQGLIQQNKVVVFSKTYCPYCKATKSTLTELGAKFTVYELDNQPDGNEAQDALQVISGQRTVPNVFINTKHIGGNSDVQTLLKSGELEKLLKEAEAL